MTRVWAAVRPFLPLVLVLPLWTACEGSGPERLVSVSGSGIIFGRVYLDVDGSRTLFPATDQPLAGVGVRLLVAGTVDTVDAATSDANGTFVFSVRPVGRYRVVVPRASLFGDSLVVTRIDTSEVTLGINDTIAVDIAVSFPAYTIAEARTRPIGEKFFVEGVALTSRAVFGDTTVHVRDTTGAIRITNARGPSVAAGDSIRMLGIAAARDGEPVLDGGLASQIQIVGQPIAVRVTTAQAAIADSARRDADLVRIVDAKISDTTTVNGDYHLTVSDGSGSVLVVFDQDAGLTRSPYVPNVTIDATGVLIPDGLGRWVLKPRGNADVILK